MAADGGIVSHAGWMSGYGYLVQIDHQNGYVTYYGHNSSLLVSVGDKVEKGQHIAARCWPLETLAPTVTSGPE
mgnify:CR=1 FL=1